MKGDKKFEKVRDIFRECADIMDRMIELEEVDQKDEGVKRELEGLLGRYTFLMVELNALSNS